MAHAGGEVCYAPEAEITEIGFVPWEPFETPERLAELRANARLIAAAPEMYEILRSIASPGINHGAARALLAKIDGGRTER